MILFHNWPTEEYKVQRVLTVCAPDQANLRYADGKRETSTFLAVASGLAWVKSASQGRFGAGDHGRLLRRRIS